ncbi:hypothetical protein HYPSUDRAFT_960910 [Hypholoma sublateritium FD-334 SS-4]|uniref:Uncharacterized protein n=1 Tax=Hypholoma sublateritium (strain FD-334 SS-4) TaxID=945553 RepID=A0A0D2NH97_HYPSF|nr:hypothetical protein HYPSUDRAFT_960910 [Hypholoma sublateritium FD-334 SS-4]
MHGIASLGSFKSTGPPSRVAYHIPYHRQPPRRSSLTLTMSSCPGRPAEVHDCVRCSQRCRNRGGQLSPSHAGSHSALPLDVGRCIDRPGYHRCRISF